MRRILIPVLGILIAGAALAQHQGHGQQPAQGQGPAQGQPPAQGHGPMHGQGHMHGQRPMQGHGSMHGQSQPSNEPASTAAFRAANDKMHKDMDIKFSGDADIDFFKGMIPHHQGAIDMAKVVLVYGKDPETKKLAEEIIAAQEKEIAFMREWLKKRGQ